MTNCGPSRSESCCLVVARIIVGLRLGALGFVTGAVAFAGFFLPPVLSYARTL
jgi:hypothetical protein